ncbi:MAG: hypothetical protein ACFFD2_26760, partial [Promethearchaeota archaeon]
TDDNITASLQTFLKNHQRIVIFYAIQLLILLLIGTYFRLTNTIFPKSLSSVIILILLIAWDIINCILLVTILIYFVIYLFIVLKEHFNNKSEELS